MFAMFIPFLSYFNYLSQKGRLRVNDARLQPWPKVAGTGW